MIQDLNALAQRVHQANIKWWQDPVTKLPIERNKGELLMLVITELAEACEGERKNLMDDKLPHRRMAEVEMADTYIRLLDFAAGFKILMTDDYIRGWPIASNKGEALFQMCCMVMEFYMKRYDPKLLSTVFDMLEKYCKNHNYDLTGAFEEKMAFNTTREDHKHEARLQAGGKQW